MQTHQTRKCEVEREFQTWAEFVEFCNSSTAVGQSRKVETDYDYYEGLPWSGTKDWPEALQLAVNGWAEGAVKADKFSGPMFHKISQRIQLPSYVYEDEGQEIDVAAYCDGIPECMITEKPSGIDILGCGNRIIRITFNVGVSGSISASTITAKGAAIAALIMLLEMGGYKVELTIHDVYATHQDRHLAHFSVIVKHTNANLDLPRVMFALAHPAMQRRMMFAAFENNPAHYAELPSYGPTVEIMPHDMGDIHIGPTTYGEIQWDDAAEAERWIIANLKEQGITLTELP